MTRLASSLRGLALTAGVLSLAGCGARTELPTGTVEPSCPGLSVESVRLGEVKQMDLLFVIDNSLSMADKQDLLRDAIPALVRRLANPYCVNADDPSIELPVPSVNDACPSGYRREFEALLDMHIGVITSSLGTAGGQICADPNNEQHDDRAHLVGTRPRGARIATYQGRGFLDWDPDAQHLPPGQGDITALEADFGALVDAAGENGCGFEATLESWYRFLIDPAPPLKTVVTGASSHPSGVDSALLAQRAQFLRPDSLVAIIMLSDENDCSVLQHGAGFLVGTTALGFEPFAMPASTSACALDPNHPCCASCSGTAAPGCPAVQDDPACQTPPTPAPDPTNLRCFEQKRRFGVDLLYPTARYAVGLRSRTLCPDSIYDDADCTCTAERERATRLGRPAPPCTARETGKAQPNPLFQNLSGGPAFERDGSQVFLAGILGIPWQDIATARTVFDPTRLEYMTAAELGRVDPTLGVDRWQLILGDPALFTPPLDPFMRESVGPRSGMNPITRDPIVAETSLDPEANAINGHERLTKDVDLQYACTFPLSTPRNCDTAAPGTRCDCRDERPTDPICQPPTGGVGTTTQYYAKAYPALRELDVLRQHGGNSVVASICPKALLGVNRELEFGYRPAIAGLIKRLHCANLDAEFETDPASLDYGTINCRLVGVTGPTQVCSCDGQGRFALEDSVQSALKLELEAVGLCGRNTGIDCATLCGCELLQTRGTGLEACQNDPDDAPLDPASEAPVDGWCYVDPAHGFGSPTLVRECPAGNLHNLRLLGSARPRPRERLFSVCGESCAKPGQK